MSIELQLAEGLSCPLCKAQVHEFVGILMGGHYLQCVASSACFTISAPTRTAVRRAWQAVETSGVDLG